MNSPHEVVEKLTISVLENSTWTIKLEIDVKKLREVVTNSYKQCNFGRKKCCAKLQHRMGNTCLPAHLYA